MAAEDIGNVYKTKIPGYDDTADIQAALKLFHYGSETVPTEDEIKSLTYPNGIEEFSVAGHLKALDNRLTDQEELGTGSDYLPFDDLAAKFPTLAEQIANDGYIVMASDSNGGAVESLYASAFYTNEAPTTDIVDGVLWVDKDSSALDTYVYNETDEEWVRINDLKNVIQAKGDILIGSSVSNIDNLAIGSNGTVLTADDTQPLGVKWQQVDTESIIISSVMGAY